MATHNDITGDALVSRVITRKYADNYDKVDKTIKAEDKVFSVYDCADCHIKVSTSNGCCPCCGNVLVAQESVEIKPSQE